MKSCLEHLISVFIQFCLFVIQFTMFFFYIIIQNVVVIILVSLNYWTIVIIDFAFTIVTLTVKK